MRTIAEPIRVILADDHPPTRAGVKAALENDGFEVVAEYGDAQGAIEGAAEHEPDVCILDIHMPGGGIAAASRISTSHPNIAVVMLTVSDEDDDLFAALRAGASGYLLKDMSPDRLPIALRGVLAGEAAVPRQLMSRVIGEFRHRGDHRAVGRGIAASLTSREWEVFELLAEGKSTSDMAKAMFVSKVTIRTHIATILRKLGVPDREAAIRLYKENLRSPR
ncbi:MAG: response regulator transcription factor [Actinomycetota bacterium]|nr:response regulator transcription factor [Actinomycetota bacterium]